VGTVVPVSYMRETAEARSNDAYRCVGPDGAHVVTADNPMMTGRCMVCRRFVVWARGHGHRHFASWRTATTVQAARWGKYGAVREPYAGRREL
jgi:hypothetical protein